MERIKAVYMSGTNHAEEATIIEFHLCAGKKREEDFYEAIWLDNPGHIHHTPISDLRVDMDSFSGRKSQQESLDIAETLIELWRKVSAERKVN